MFRQIGASRFIDLWMVDEAARNAVQVFRRERDRSVVRHVGGVDSAQRSTLDWAAGLLEHLRDEWGIELRAARALSRAVMAYFFRKERE